MEVTTFIGIPANIRLDEDVFRLRLHKTSSRRLQDFLFKTNMFALALRLQKTSWSRPIYLSWSYVFKTSSIRLTKMSSRCFQDVFNTSCKRVVKISSTSLQDVLKTSSRHLQDVFKIYCQVKVFLVTQFQDIFETSSKRF